MILIDTARQSLDYTDPAGYAHHYAVSTSKHGVGELHGSLKTPRGRHMIRAKIGAGCAVGTVFVGRRPTG